MTAFAPFPPIPPGAAATRADPVPGPACAETRLAAAVLGLRRDGAVDRLSAAFGAGPGAAIGTARDRLAAGLDGADADPGALALLVATALHGPDGEEHARHLALALVPAHRMPMLVSAARDFGLALRRAVLSGQGAVPSCPAAHASRPG